MVNPAIADVIGPTVAAKGPDRLLAKHVPHVVQGLQFLLVPRAGRNGFCQRGGQCLPRGPRAFGFPPVVQPFLGTQGHSGGGVLLLGKGPSQIRRAAVCRAFTARFMP